MRAEYEQLRLKYPETISLEQMREICHISKRKAKKVVEDGLVSCRRLAVNTSPYQISLKSVVDYANRNAHKFNPILNLSMTQQKRAKIHLFYTELLSSHKDVMTPTDIYQALGIETMTVMKYAQHGLLDHFRYHKAYMIYKASVIHFACSEKYTFSRVMGKRKSEVITALFDYLNS